MQFDKAIVVTSGCDQWQMRSKSEEIGEMQQRSCASLCNCCLRDFLGSLIYFHHEGLDDNHNTSSGTSLLLISEVIFSIYETGVVNADSK